MRRLFGAIKCPEPLPVSPLQHIAGVGIQPMDADLEGKNVMLLGHIIRVGATLTKVRLGNHTVDVLNSSLRIAHKQADESMFGEDV